jgi:preprotein translocase subunit SecE
VKKYILGLLIVCALVMGVIAATGDTTPVTAAATEGTTPVATSPATGAAVAPTGSTTPAPAAGTAKSTPKNGNQWVGLLIWAAVIGGGFAFLWSKGYLVKIRNYFAETQEELKKCSWPSRDELKGSTVVILITTALLGLFTVVTDWVLANLMRLIT